MSRRRWPDSTNSLSEKPGTIQAGLDAGRGHRHPGYDPALVPETDRQEIRWQRPPTSRSTNDLWVANYYSARNPLRLSSLVILGVVARMFRCATRSSCWCT